MPVERAREIGLLVKAWRLDYGLSRPEMVQELNRRGVELTVDYLAKLESGVRDLSKAAVDIREGIRAVLGVGSEEWREKTSLFVPEPVGALRHVEHYNETLKVPEYPAVAAGIHNLLQNIPPENYVTLDRSLLRNVKNPDRLGIMRVNGDSMYAENLPRPIPPGSSIVIEVGAAPTEGDLVVAWIGELELSVLKEFRRTGEGKAFLRSYKPGGPNFFESEYPNMHVVAVVRAVVYRP